MKYNVRGMKPEVFQSYRRLPIIEEQINELDDSEIS
jgi:hypothetical protein